MYLRFYIKDTMSSSKEMEYSIIICTYNPDERLLKRCLNAVRALSGGSPTFEVILVDNNSTHPIEDLPYVKDFLNSCSIALLIKELKQGLNYARLAGVRASKGKYIVFFDDDNEPDPDYLVRLRYLHLTYPSIAAWGPGRVSVDFIDGLISNELEVYAREAFQERFEKETIYAQESSWQSCYPYGTGLCLNRHVVEGYEELTKSGRFNILDRTGNQLTSGGDVQMVLYCISLGFGAGVDPELGVKHIIPGKRTSLDYLKRLTFGNSICYATCVSEVFPEQLVKLNANLIKEGKLVRKTFKRFIAVKLSSDPVKVLELIDYIGGHCGIYRAIGKPTPKAIDWLLRRLL